MKHDALCRMPLEEIARLIETRTISPVEVTQCVLDRIERVNAPLNAYMTVTAEAALEAARASEQSHRSAATLRSGTDAGA